MKPTESSRIWLVGGAAVALIVVVIAWFGLIGPKLATVPAQHAVADSAAAANAALQAKVTTLQAESKNMGALVRQLAVARNELPIQADLPTYIVQLGAQAKLAHVGLTNLSIGSASVAAAAATAATAATGTASTTDTSTTPAATAAAGSTATGSTAVAPVVAAGPAGQLFQIQITMTTSGTFRAQQDFLTELQHPGSRAALITSAQLAPAAATAAAAPSPRAGTVAAGSTPTGAAASIDGASDLTTVLDIFVAPQTPAAAAELTKQLSGRTSR